MIDDLTAMALSADAASDRLMPELEHMLEDGMDPEKVVLTAIVPAARRLGEMWMEDEIGFADVTLGINRLSTAIIQIEMDQPVTMVVRGEVLLSNAPGDTHGFGAMVVGFCLRRHGWAVTSPELNEADQIVRLGQSRHFDALALSIGNDRLLTDCRRLIQRVRQRTRNSGLKVVVGGPSVSGRPEIVKQLGADFSAMDAVEMVARLDETCLGPARPS